MSEKTMSTVDELRALVEEIRTEGGTPVFSPEEDGTWIYAADGSRLSPLKAIVPTDVFHAWRDAVQANI